MQTADLLLTVRPSAQNGVKLDPGLRRNLLSYRLGSSDETKHNVRSLKIRLDRDPLSTWKKHPGRSGRTHVKAAVLDRPGTSPRFCLRSHPEPTTDFESWYYACLHRTTQVQHERPRILNGLHTLTKVQPKHPCISYRVGAIKSSYNQQRNHRVRAAEVVYLERKVAGAPGQFRKSDIYCLVDRNVPRGRFREAHPSYDAERIGDPRGLGGWLLSLFDALLRLETRTRSVKRR